MTGTSARRVREHVAAIETATTRLGEVELPGRNGSTPERASYRAKYFTAVSPQQLTGCVVPKSVNGCTAIFHQKCRTSPFCIESQQFSDHHRACNFQFKFTSNSGALPCTVFYDRCLESRLSRSPFTRMLRITKAALNGSSHRLSLREQRMTLRRPTPSFCLTAKICPHGKVATGGSKMAWHIQARATFRQNNRSGMSNCTLNGRLRPRSKAMVRGEATVACI